jgi:hypothetical protein
VQITRADIPIVATVLGATSADIQVPLHLVGRRVDGK